MKLILLTLLAVAAYGQSIVIRVTQADGTVEVAKVSGIPAAAAIDTLQQFMATQKTCDTATPPVCTGELPHGGGPAEIALAGALGATRAAVPIGGHEGRRGRDHREDCRARSEAQGSLRRGEG